MVPESSKVLLRTSLVEIIDLSGCEFEGHCSQVIAQSLLLAAGSDGHDILINTISQANLARANGVLLGQTGQNIVKWSRSRLCRGSQGAVSFSGNTLVLVVSEKFAVLQVSVEFDLVEGRRDPGGLDYGIEMVRQEV